MDKGDVGGLIGGIAVAGHNWPFLLEFKGGKGLLPPWKYCYTLSLISLILLIIKVIAFTGYVSWHQLL